MSSPGNIKERDDMLAAEYALGTLPHGERVLFEKRLKDDRALQDRVAWWNRQYMPLGEEIDPVAAPASVLAGIETRLFSSPSRSSWWESVAFWRGLAVASLAALIVVGGLFANSVSDQPSQGEVFVAQVAGEASDVRLAAFFDDSTNTLKLNRTAGEAATGRDFELWIIAGDGAPVSLGVLPRDNSFQITVQPEIRAALSGGSVLAISDEPAGGSPTGQPTGAVLATGAVTKI